MSTGYSKYEPFEDEEFRQIKAEIEYILNY